MLWSINHFSLKPRQVAIVINLALIVGVAVWQGGPQVAHWITDDWTAMGDSVLVVLSGTAVFGVVFQAISLWVVAHDGELKLLGVNLVALPLSIILLATLVSHLSVLGAAWALTVRAILQCGGGVMVMRQLRG